MEVLAIESSQQNLCYSFISEMPEPKFVIKIVRYNNSNFGWQHILKHER